MKYDVAFFQKLFQDRQPKPIGKYGKFAVLMPLVYQDQEPHLLFEVRAETLKKQPGEVCFPGGKVEEGESPGDGAIRETMEELNIPSERIRMISEADYIYTYSGFTLFSFLGVLEAEDVASMVVNQDEVKETFLVPLQFFLEHDPATYHMKVRPDAVDFPYHLIGREEGYQWREGASTVDIYHYQDHIIWGLTAKLVKDLVCIVKEGVQWV